MGCHTWCYRKVDMDTIDMKTMKDEIIKSNIINIEYMRKDLNKIHKGTFEHEFDSQNEKDNYLKDLKSLIKYNENIIKRINNGELEKKRKLIKLYVETLHGGEYSVFENTMYMKTDYHDLFRINYDDETLLHNFEETIDYIKNNKCYGGSYYSEEHDKIITEEINIERIKTFWSENKNGLIEFG